MNQRPGFVTVGIPTHNRSGYLMQAVESTLAQTFRSIEVVVSDNNSTDDTWERLQELRDPRVHIIRQSRNIGMVGNFNACLEAATSELFLMLSDDDILAPTAVEKLSKPFREPIYGGLSETVGLTWCPCLNMTASENIMWQTRQGPFRESSVSLMEGLFNGTRGPQFCGVMVRTRDALDFKYDFSRHGVLCDSANWGRVALLYDDVVCIQEPLVKYRVHGASDTAQADCDQWRDWGRQQHMDFVEVLRFKNDSVGEKRLLKTKNHLLTNLTVTVLMRTIGRAGWKRIVAREVWRSRRIMFTPFVVKRAIRDGLKLLQTRSH